jgi:hypothetical protein
MTDIAPLSLAIGQAHDAMSPLQILADFNILCSAEIPIMSVGNQSSVIKNGPFQRDSDIVM